jgi:hypothetical protein
LINLLTDVAKEMAESEAARKQAEGAHRHIEGLMSKDPAVRFYFYLIKLKIYFFKKIDPREIPVSSGDAPRYIDPKVHDAEIEKLKQGFYQ